MAASPIASAKDWLSVREGTRRLLDLSQAAPSYPTAPVIADRVAEVARSDDGGGYAPPPGLPGLRDAFAAEIRTDYGSAEPAAVQPEHILPTAGCNQAFCIVASALAGPGDEIILPLPYYFNHSMWLELDGVRPVYCETGDDLVPDPDQVRTLITERTRAILLVTPGNPSGVTIPPEVIDAFGALAAESDIALILDETYRTFREDDGPAHHLFTDPQWSDHVVSLHSFSKDLAIPGYRVGAVIADPRLLDEAAKFLDCVAICAPRIGQEAALEGLLHASAWRREQVERIHRNLATFRDTMTSRPGGYELVSSGAFFGWVRHPFVGRPSADVVRQLVLDQDVLVIPGTAFLPDDRAMLRFSFANLDHDDFAELAMRLTESAQP